MLRSLFCLCIAACLSGLAIAEPMKIVGSDLLAGSVDLDLQNFSKANELSLTMEFKGSRLGLESLQNKHADLGLLVFGADDARPGPEFSNIVIGYLTTVIAVPQSLSISQLTFAQIGGVFGAVEKGDFRRWADIGVIGSQAQRNILAVAAGRQAGLALDIFRYSVLSKPELKSTVVLLPDAAEAASRISSDEGGIALLPTAPPDNGKLKVLLLAKGPKDVAYGPTAENLHSGDYPLRLPVHLVFRKGDAKRLAVIIRHILADETQPALNAANVVPLPTQARNQVIFDLETM
jgi:hypothetical protein